MLGTRATNLSYPFDVAHHEPGSVAATGRCSWHGWDGRTVESCSTEAVVSFQDSHGHWHSGCAEALTELVERGEIQALGQGG
ncbi:hypothetical protein [Nocardioides sp. SR21]|uniref:hypothetical protein n=1 Tax=Nocardioides sp. SR21 TaxID=2919501 RepID=UPI001FAAB525|nr:hypothetical protein [Nocardioides sp. SR21]